MLKINKKSIELYEAISADDFELAEKLLQEGADPNGNVMPGGWHPRTALFQIVAGLNDPKYVDLLIKYGADVDFENGGKHHPQH
jgi:ankyrin repeat protein